MNNIIICSDGTWQPPESDTGNKQVVFYDWGVGSGIQYRSPALRGLLERVGGSWDEIQVIFLPLNRKNAKKAQR